MQSIETNQPLQLWHEKKPKSWLVPHISCGDHALILRDGYPAKTQEEKAMSREPSAHNKIKPPTDLHWKTEHNNSDTIPRNKSK